MALTIEPAPDLEEIRSLFREYQASLGVDLGFQGFEAELASLPAPYESPRGGLYRAVSAGRTVGCLGFKPLEDGVCEMKRLYVRPASRGLGAGRALGEHVVREAAHRGYRVMRLDTLARLEPAVALYRELGFVEIPAYYDNPLPERVVYMERHLSARR